MTTTLYIVLVVAWLTWVMPFFLAKRPLGEAWKLDRRARWGIALQAVAYSLLWQEPVLGSASGPLAHSGVNLLLRWRERVVVDGGSRTRTTMAIRSGLNKNHELVTSGPYRLVRHPIYLSMLCLLLGTGFMITPWATLTISLVAYVIGTEIRIRIEDRLLAENFGDEFHHYRHSAPAYISFIR